MLILFWRFCRSRLSVDPDRQDQALHRQQDDQHDRCEIAWDKNQIDDHQIDQDHHGYIQITRGLLANPDRKRAHFLGSVGL